MLGVTANGDIHGQLRPFGEPSQAIQFLRIPPCEVKPRNCKQVGACRLLNKHTSDSRVPRQELYSLKQSRN